MEQHYRSRSGHQAQSPYLRGSLQRKNNGYAFLWAIYPHPDEFSKRDAEAWRRHSRLRQSLKFLGSKGGIYKGHHQNCQQLFGYHCYAAPVGRVGKGSGTDGRLPRNKRGRRWTSSSYADTYGSNYLKSGKRHSQRSHGGFLRGLEKWKDCALAFKSALLLWKQQICPYIHGRA